MPSNRAEFEEAFEIIGKKADTIDKDTMGVVLRSLGLNPTNDEVNSVFGQVNTGGMVDIEGLMKAADTIKAGMESRDLSKEITEAFSVFDKEKVGQISTA